MEILIQQKGRASAGLLNRTPCVDTRVDISGWKEEEREVPSSSWPQLLQIASLTEWKLRACTHTDVGASVSVPTKPPSHFLVSVWRLVVFKFQAAYGHRPISFTDKFSALRISVSPGSVLWEAPSFSILTDQTTVTSVHHLLGHQHLLPRLLYDLAFFLKTYVFTYSNPSPYLHYY